MASPQKIVLFGGSFDPPHLGHMNIASYILSLSYDGIWFVPTGDERYDRSSFASSTDRYEMLKMAIAECMPESADAAISDVQLNGGLSSSYTVDLLDHLRALHPETEFFFLIGSDRVPTLPSWKEYQRLVQLTHFLVLPRLGEEEQTPCPEYCTYLDAQDFVPTDYASSTIRERVARREPINDFVPESVRKYILEKKLYV